MSSPKVVFDFVKSLNLPEGKNLSVVGNQVISIGKWDTLLGSSINFGAMVSADKEDIQYPSCKKFRGYACVQQVQMFQSGTCIEENKQLSRLTCCGVDEMSQVEASGMTKKYIWTEKNNCSSSL